MILLIMLHLSRVLPGAANEVKFAPAVVKLTSQESNDTAVETKRRHLTACGVIQYNVS